MLNTARTYPTSYSKRAHAFWAAGGNDPAAMARLGSVSFVDFKIPRSVPAGLVAELVLQHRPARVEDGLRHLRFDELGRTDITDDDEFVFTSDPRGPLVKMMAACVRDLRVDRSNAALVSSALRDGERGFVLAVVLQGRHDEAITAGRDGLQSEIDPDLTGAGRKLLVDIALEADVPATARVLNEGARFDLAADIARPPEPELTLAVGDAVAVKLKRLGSEWHPPESTLRSEARTKAWTSFVRVAGESELTAHCVYGFGHDVEWGARSAGQIVKVKSGWPSHVHAALAATIGFALSGDAEVPDLIASGRHPDEMPLRTGIFDAEFEGQDHHSTIAQFAVLAILNGESGESQPAQEAE